MEAVGFGGGDRNREAKRRRGRRKRRSGERQERGRSGKERGETLAEIADCAEKTVLAARSLC